MQFHQFAHLKVPAKQIQGFGYGWYSYRSQRKFSELYYFGVPVKLKKLTRGIKFCEQDLTSTIDKVATPLS